MAATIDTSLDSTYVFHQLDNYPWDSDQEFQGGLQAILGSVQDPAQVEHLTLRAKCYYYARKAGTPVDFEGYKRWVQNQQTGASTNGHAPSAGSEEDVVLQPAEQQNPGDNGMAGAPKPASFAEICEMIAEGKPIPGIKDIPDTILEGQASDAQKEKRRKPWERSAGSAEKPSWMT